MINPLDHRAYYDRFIATPRGQLIQSQYDIVYCEPNLLDYYLRTGRNVMGVAQWELFGTTPRELSGSRELEQLTLIAPRPTSFSCAPFYYLEYLEAVNPRVIADIGCGWNRFKHYIPAIQGWDDKGSHADHSQRYSEEFRSRYRESFDCAFSINAVSASTWAQVSVSVEEFSTLVPPGGRIFLSFPGLWLYLNTPYEWYRSMGLSLDDPQGISQWVLDSISQLGHRILVFDSRIGLNDSMISHDGDLRIVIERC
jgi:hypothetical protein